MASTECALHYVVRPFQASDYLELADEFLRKHDRTLADNPEETARIYELLGPAYTGVLDGRIIVAAGVCVVWRGLGRAWAVLNDLGRQHPHLVHRAVARGLRQIIRAAQLRRVEADVMQGFAQGQAWVERLGFHLESVMPRYGPGGETFTRYVLLCPREA